MYVLSTLPCSPTELDRVFAWLSDMLSRAVLCLTAFFASTGVLTQNGALSNTGVQAQYLLGLGTSSLAVVFPLGPADGHNRYR